MSDMVRLIEPLIPALRRYARALTRDRAAADDLVQDCLERAVGHWQQRRADGDARTWIFAILHNLAVSGMRRARRRGPHVPMDDADEAALARPPTQEDGLHRHDVLAALAELPEDQRTVLLLVSVEGLSYAEAAVVTGVPVGTVMSRLARGRERLRRAMEEEPALRQPVLRRVK